MARLAEKIAIVTGGARGIGRATAELFAAEGAMVYALDREASDPFEDDRIVFRELEVDDEAGWNRIVEEVIGRYGVIDILINNAGVAGSYAKLDETTMEDWHQNIAVNQTGVFLGMRAVLPHMRARKSGSIVNLSSIWGITGVAAVASYHATKGAVRTLSKHAAVAYAPEGIRVNSLHPGIVETPAVAQQAKEMSDVVIERTPLGRMGKAIELAQGCLFLASDESSFMTGAELVIDGGYTAQ